MKPSEVAMEFELFKVAASKLDGDDLLDAWIEHNDKADQIPDVDLLKSQYLEVLLIQRFGLMEWNSAVESRRKKNSTYRA